jgi:hypothetical protein
MSSWLLPSVFFRGFILVFVLASDAVFVFFAMAGKTRIEDDMLVCYRGLLCWVFFIRWKPAIANWASELKFPHGYSTPWIEGCKTIFPSSLKVKHDHWQPAD